jgi:hypothetical protein
MVLYATNKNLIIFKLLQPLFKKSCGNLQAACILVLKYDYLVRTRLFGLFL